MTDYILLQGKCWWKSVNFKKDGTLNWSKYVYLESFMTFYHEFATRNVEFEMREMNKVIKRIRKS